LGLGHKRAREHATCFKAVNYFISFTTFEASLKTDEMKYSTPVHFPHASTMIPGNSNPQFTEDLGNEALAKIPKALSYWEFTEPALVHRFAMIIGDDGER
jgi:hypothetical protein